MSLVLFIDTSSKNCSTLLAKEGEVILERFKANTRSHAQLLPHFINEIFKESGLSRDDLSAVVVSAGPGSYTGVRIGMSIAKGIAYTMDIPFIALDSLESLADAMIHYQGEKEALYIATMDSRNGEIYFAVKDGEGMLIEPSQPARVVDLKWSEWNNRPLYYAGSTEHKLNESEVKLYLEKIPIEYSAKNYLHQGFLRLMNKNYDDVVYKEPNYLKPFQ